jgi:hypothetical protein
LSDKIADAPTLQDLAASHAFRDEKGDSPISEFALRVVVEFEGLKFYVVGTATLICGHLAITARHVLDHVIRTYGAKKTDTKTGIDEFEIGDYELNLIQVFRGRPTGLGVSSRRGLLGQILPFSTSA